MFGFGDKKAEVTVAKPVNERPSRMDAAPECDGETLKKYEALATSVGFEPAELVMAKFKVWLRENAMPTYDFDTVERYLGIEFKKVEKYFHWVPLRDKDKGKIHLLGFCGVPGDGSRNWNTNGFGLTENDRTYSKAVPYSVLETVKKIGERFPELGLYVSDVALPKADPFLLVGLDGALPMVVECWDEPNFK